MQANPLRHGTIVLLLIVMSLIPLYGQRMNSSYQAYVREYADEAIRQMRKHKIPASITIAQGLLESNAGASSLASVHNNHFGIKCHKAWQGKRTYHDDDENGECFRSYESALDSYTDHSYFLQQPRYKSLFRLSPYDYQGWAKGLQKCGYATDKGYANKLIAIIELYSLYELDNENYPAWLSKTGSSASPTTKRKKTEELEKPLKKRKQYNCYGLEYVLAEEGDSFATIARDVEINADRLASFNDAPIDFPLKKNDVIYLQKKNKRGESGTPDHVVTIGESMHSISQLYGIRIEYLYKINGLDMETYVPLEGDVLQLW